MQPIKLILLLILGLPLSRLPLRGQTKSPGTVAGSVINDTGQPVGFATVTLLKVRDSSLVKGVITDTAGRYLFTQIPPGQYLVAVSMIGMLKTYSSAFYVEKSKTLPPLILKVNSRLLQGVNITAAKPFIEHKPGMTIVNVENSIVSAGNSALEVLKKSPGVTVDNNDNIGLLGQQGVTILINGRNTHLSAEQVAQMLKSMPASSISKIEIMTIPSSKYDAEGSGGIINLIMKKNANEGFNGNLMVGWGQATHSRWRAGTNLNYKNGKWSLYGGYNYGHGVFSHLLKLHRQYLDKNGQPTDYMVQPTRSRSQRTNHHFNAGLDFRMDDNNSIGLVFNGGTSTNSDDTKNTSEIFNTKDVLQSFSRSKNNSGTEWTNVSYNLHYKHLFDTLGTELSVNLDYSDFNERELTHFTNNFFDAAGSPVKEGERKKGNVPTGVEVKSGKIDFEHPLGEKMKLMAGIKTSYVTSDNDVKYWSYEKPDWVVDSGQTNHFIYTENINAAYVSVNSILGKGWTAKAGLRLEQTIAKGEQKTTDEMFKRNYWQLFPTVFVQKEINKNNQLQLAYTRRISRPDYERLNPFRYYIDPYTFEKGNPFLKPELTRSYELTYIFRHVFTVAFGYGHTRDVINETVNVADDEINGHKVIYDTRDNIGSRNRFTMALTASVPVTPWWRSNTSVTPLYGHYYGQYENKKLDNAKFSVFINSTNTFLLPAEFKAELSGRYHSPMAYGALNIAAQGIISAGLSKSLFHDKIDVKLNVRDLFNLRHSEGTAHYPNMNLRFQNSFESRRINLTVTWNFGNKKLKMDRHTSTGIEDEQSRIEK